MSHSWQLSPKEAIGIQQRLSSKVSLEDNFAPIQTVAGVDVGFEENGRITRAAVAVLDAQTLQLQDIAIARRQTSFPYVPGLLSFRELPAILAAIKRLQSPVDIFLCDGQGIAHPRRFGIACHLGVLCDTPSIGVGKSRLVGTHDTPGQEKGDWAPLRDKGELIGAVVRTRAHTLPLYISPGHKISLQSAIDVVLRCTTRYKLPETTRWAHKIASREISLDALGV